MVIGYFLSCIKHISGKKQAIIKHIFFKRFPYLAYPPLTLNLAAENGCLKVNEYYGVFCLICLRMLLISGHMYISEAALSIFLEKTK